MNSTRQQFDDRAANRVARKNGTPARAVRALKTTIAAAALAMLAGCAASQRSASQPAVPADSNAELMEYIGDQPLVTIEPAYRATYILHYGEVHEGGFAELTSALEADKLISPSWKHGADDFLNRATAGYLICRAAEIRSGLNWQLTGLGRYAWRELQYRRIAGAGGELGLVSGGEFLGLLARADEYMHAAGKRGVRKAELGPEPGSGGP